MLKVLEIREGKELENPQHQNPDFIQKHKDPEHQETPLSKQWTVIVELEERIPKDTPLS